MLRICTRAGLPPYQWRIGGYDHTIYYHCTARSLLYHLVIIVMCTAVYYVLP